MQQGLRSLAPIAIRVVLPCELYCNVLLIGVVLARELCSTTNNCCSKLQTAVMESLNAHMAL